MKRFCLIVVLLLSFSPLLRSQQTPDNSKIRKVTPPMPVEQIIKTLASKESEFSAARNQYMFRQEVIVHEVGIGNNIVGEFYRVSDIVFDDSGKRIEKIIKSPQPTLQTLSISNEDIAGFGAVNPFALTTFELPNFQVDYVGKEKIDELDTYVFDITPKFMLPFLDKIKHGKKIGVGEGGIEGRSFMGRIWVDDRDLQIVKTAGQAVPEVKQRFPHFENYREN